MNFNQIQYQYNLIMNELNKHPVQNNNYTAFQQFVNIICHQVVSDYHANYIYDYIQHLCNNNITPITFKNNIINNQYNRAILNHSGFPNKRIDAIGTVITKSRNSANPKVTTILNILKNHIIPNIGQWTIEMFELNTGINMEVFPDNDEAVNRVISEKFNMNVHNFINILNENQVENIGDIFLILQKYADLQY